MHRVFQSFIDGLANSADLTDLRNILSRAGAALDLSCFAYLSLPYRRGSKPQLISTYPLKWTDHYLRNRYERFDPVIVEALANSEPFEWGLGISPKSLSKLQLGLLEEAAQFGIRCGFTVPIHASRGPIAAVTFAADERRPAFERCIESNKHVLQLMAMYFHAHARRKLATERIVDGVSLSPRELECLEWAAQGKSAWEIGQILKISRRTAAFHLDNAKTKFGVRTICQAVARLAASRSAIN
jgi:LuxR family transcriptional regulator, activator of conjugal transfer of Ti plasmids